MFNSSAGERRQPTPPELLMEEKERFLKEAHEFGEEMVKLLNDSDGEMYWPLSYQFVNDSDDDMYWTLSYQLVND